jgi:hypothetical protein
VNCGIRRLRPSLLCVLFLLACIDASAQTRDAAFALHAGAAYARVPGSEFEIVGSLSGQDLFAQIDAREASADFALFLSQRLWAADSAAARLYATLGTGISEPGRLLYFGGSLGASRALVTLGAATALVDSGVLPAPDLVFRAGGDRTLFGGVTRNRKWGFFVAISFGIVQ